MTSELFARLIISDDVVNRIKEYRNRLPELDRLKQEISNLELLIDANPDSKEPMNDDLKREIKQLQDQCRKITQIKGSLPVLMYQATFDKTASKKGYQGYWRKQSAARLNGLFMLDVDHLSGRPSPGPSLQGGESDRPADSSSNEGLSNMELTPRELYKKIRLEHPELFSSPQGGIRGGLEGLILLVHVTPSGRGLRIVAKADASIGNLADNQAWLSSLLDVEPDKACKDASRCSFCPGFEDILYINKEELFTYENKEYDAKYGPLYRGGNSQPTAVLGNGSHEPLRPAAQIDGESRPADDGGSQGAAAENDGLAERLKQGYHGKAFNEICERWFEKNCHGRPSVGDRHQSLLRLAYDLRYICDNDAKLLARILAECEVGKEIASERGTAELDRIAGDACAAPKWRTVPKRFQAVLDSLGVQSDERGTDGEPETPPRIDYREWWLRLEPLLKESPVLREAVAPLPDEHKLAGVLAAGAMLGTYLTRCWWEHFDGNEYRLSFLVYIIGSAASGKSFVPKLDSLIMAPMIAADRVGREWERQYKEEMKKRSASSKNAKQEAPEQQHPVIRYVPSTISNAMLYRRLTDAIDNEAMGPDEQPMHLHCYTCEAELATALRAQQGSWAGKLDLECKSFQNEVAGVDYANDASTNGIIQVNWNQVVTGTPDALARKIRPATVLDGLVTRLVLFPMPANDFAMIEHRKAYIDHERESLLRSIGLKLEGVKGRLDCQRLVDFCYDYECSLANEARVEQDLCLDYFRKRIPLIMVRYTLVRMVCRMIQSADSSVECRTESVEFATAHPSPKPSSAVANSKLYTLNSSLKIEDSDLEFARLIGDWCLMAQMFFFGQQVMDALDSSNKSFSPRRRSNKVRARYESLPDEGITAAMLVERGMNNSLQAACKLLKGWVRDGLVSLLENNTYKKNFKTIPL